MSKIRPVFEPAFVRDVTVDPANVPAASTLDVSVTVAEALKENGILVEAESLEADLGIVAAWCATAGTVKVRLMNASAGGINPASQTWTIVGF